MELKFRLIAALTTFVIGVVFIVRRSRLQVESYFGEEQLDIGEKPVELQSEDSLDEYAEEFNDTQSKNVNSKLSSEEKVLALEVKRKAEGYKPGWLYYQARRQGLIREFLKLQKEGRLEISNKKIINDQQLKNLIKNPKLALELVPCTCWVSNLRSLFSKEKWATMKQACYRSAGFRCEVCGGRGEKWPVEAHEVWEYDDMHLVQIFKRVCALCPSCHQVKHYGLAAQLRREKRR